MTTNNQQQREPTAEEIEAQKKEMARQMQLMIHSDPAVSLFYANALAQSGAYGAEVTEYSKDGAKKALSSGTQGIESLVSDTWAKQVKEAEEKGIDLESISLNANTLRTNTEPFLYGGIDSLKAEDVLGLMGIGDENGKVKKGLKNITDEQQDMYMSDLKESAKEVYEKLSKDYIGMKKLSSIQSVYGVPKSKIIRKWSEQPEESTESAE